MYLCRWVCVNVCGGMCECTGMFGHLQVCECVWLCKPQDCRSECEPGVSVCECVQACELVREHSQVCVHAGASAEEGLSFPAPSESRHSLGTECEWSSGQAVRLPSLCCHAGRNAGSSGISTRLSLWVG